MKVTIQPAKLTGTVRVIASKSAAHRLLIAAALADYPTRIICEELSQDIEATAGALKALGAGISYINASGSFLVVPVRQDQQDQQPEKEKEAFGLKPLDSSAESLTLDVGESGSTLRFLLPVICALGRETKIVMHGRMPDLLAEAMGNEFFMARFKTEKEGQKPIPEDVFKERKEVIIELNRTLQPVSEQANPTDSPQTPSQHGPGTN